MTLIAEWLFAYGSVIFRPSFRFVERRIAVLDGWTRRFSQASDDHRGTPEAPGRVLTLARALDRRVRGVAFRLDARALEETFAALDHREKAGYVRTRVTVRLAPTTEEVDAVAYIAHPGNAWDAGESPPDELAATIARSSGPSGSNADYLFALADSLRAIAKESDALEDDDAPIFALEAAVRRLSAP